MDICVCGPDLREHHHELEGPFYLWAVDLPILLERRHLAPLPHDVPKVQVRCQHADLPRADTCGMYVGKDVCGWTMYDTHQTYNNAHMQAGRPLILAQAIYGK